MSHHVPSHRTRARVKPLAAAVLAAEALAMLFLLTYL